MTTQPTHVELKQLVPDPDNPRIDVGDITELATSIRNIGVLQSLLVRPVDDGTYAVVAGSRRHAAMIEAKLPKDYLVPVQITNDNGEHSTLVGLVENAQRQDLDIWEQADAFARLIDEYGLKQRQIAEMTGFDPSLVSRRVAIAQLNGAARRAIARVNADAGRPIVWDEELVKVARAYHSVPTEVWDIIKTGTDLRRMMEAQDLVNARTYMFRKTKREDLVIGNSETIPVPEGKRLVTDRENAAEEIEGVKILKRHDGVIRQYHEWVPYTFETIEEPTKTEQQQAKDERAEVRAANARRKEAVDLWYDQWFAALSKYPMAKAKTFIVEHSLRLFEADRSPYHWLSRVRDRFEDASVTPQMWMLSAIMAETPGHLLTGNPRDFKLEGWLAELAKECKVKVPKVS